MEEKQGNVQYGKPIAEYCMLDDMFMRVCLNKNIPAAQLILRIILDQDDIIVDKVEIQRDIPNLFGHGVRFDILAHNRNGEEYDIEFERSDTIPDTRRSRYYQSLMDAHALKKGEDYDKLKKHYVIFICEHDLWERNKPIYSVKQLVTDGETESPYDNGQYTLYVNGTWVGDTPLGKLLADFREKSPGKIHYAELAERVKYLKETSKGASEMGSESKRIYDEGRTDTFISMILTMLKSMTPEAVAAAVERPLSDILAVQNGTYTAA